LATASALSADVVLVGGDLGHMASAEGIIYAWAEVQRVATALGAPLVLATAGNHDLDSRHLSGDPDLKAVLQDLVPPFPTPHDALNDQYFSRYYAVINHPEYRLVTLNSCGVHTNPGQIENGWFDRRTADRLTKELAEAESRPVQILVCHHHPYRFGDIDLADLSEMKGGHLLLERLGSGKYGQWTVVHGHKHMPRIGYAAGGALSPVVFSAGSLSSSLYLELQTTSRNQFYLLSFEPEAAAALGAGVVGTFRAWNWVSALGWTEAPPGSELPPRGGFGYRSNPTELARRVEKVLAASGRSTMPWTDIVRALPELEYLIPSDLAAVRTAMVEKVGLNVSGADVLDEVALP
jgi:3',5'-cyclic AMP phosphodiesterase CpdA